MCTVANIIRNDSLVWVCSGVLMCGSVVGLKGQSPSGAPGGSPIVTAMAAQEPPTVDGDVLADVAWANASVATGFQQSAPDDGQPATQRTEVRVVFTSDTLFIGVVCYDSDPSMIVVSDSRRDSSMNDTDSIQIVIDSIQKMALFLVQHLRGKSMTDRLLMKVVAVACSAPGGVEDFPEVAAVASILTGTVHGRCAPWCLTWGGVRSLRSRFGHSAFQHAHSSSGG